MPTSKTDETPVIDETVDKKIKTGIDKARLPPLDSLDTAENLASTTTAEQDLSSAARRGVNFNWEDTQRKIALYAVFLTMSVSAIVILTGLIGFFNDNVLLIAAFNFMSNTASLIVGFYFNKLRVGSVKKEDDPDDK